MKVNREATINLLETVRPGLSPKEIQEQSSCFVFKDGRVMTFNDEVACSQDCPIKLTGAVQSKPLLELLRKMGEDNVEISPNGTELHVSGKKRKAGIRFEKEVLLPIDNVEKPGKWKPLAEDFAEAVDIATKCASRDESQFTLTCLHIHPKYVEATDNYQLVRYVVDTGLKKPTLVKADSMKGMVPLGMTEFSQTDNWLHFRNPSGLVYSVRRTVDDYLNLTPHLEGSGEKTTLPKSLIDAADRASVFSKDNADEDQVQVTLMKDKIRIRGEGASGWFQETKASKFTGKEMTFNIPPALLMDLTRQHNDCFVMENRIKVDGGKFTYVTSLGKAEQ